MGKLTKAHIKALARIIEKIKQLQEQIKAVPNFEETPTFHRIIATLENLTNNFNSLRTITEKDRNELKAQVFNVQRSLTELENKIKENINIVVDSLKQEIGEAKLAWVKEKGFEKRIQKSLSEIVKDIKGEIEEIRKELEKYEKELRFTKQGLLRSSGIIGPSASGVEVQLEGVKQGVFSKLNFVQGNNISITQSQVSPEGKINLTLDTNNSSLTNTFVPYTGATQDLNLGNCKLIVDTNTLYVDSVNHRVGIGTTTPQNKLEVIQQSGGGSAVLLIKPTDQTNASAILRLQTNNAVGSGASNSHADLQFYDGTTMGFRFLATFGNNPTARYGGFIAYTDRDGNKLPLRFFTTDAGGNLQTALFIQAGQPAGTSGNIGIGTTNPSQKLTVAGNIGIQAGANAFIGTLDNYALSLRTNNADRVFITNTGNVGIGTTNPSQKFHLYGGTAYLEYRGTDIGGHGLDQYLTRSITTSGTYYSRGLLCRAHKYVASDVTDSGYIIGFWGQAFVGVEGTHAGTLASVYGGSISAGIYGTGHTGTVGNAYVLNLTPFAQSGTITNLFTLYLGSLLTGGTVTNYWGIYQADTAATNYFAGKMGIRIATPHSTLHINGSIATALVNKTAAYTLTASDSIVTCDASAGAFTISLPTASGIAGRQYTIKKIDSSANAITIQPYGTETIDGAATYTLSAQWKYVTIVSNGTNWLIVSAN